MERRGRLSVIGEVASEEELGLGYSIQPTFMAWDARWANCTRMLLFCESQYTKH